MWSEIKENGKVKYIERYIDPLTMKSKKISITLSGKDTAVNRKKAMETLQAKITIATDYSSITRKDITLDQLYQKYAAYQKTAVKASTSERNSRTLKGLVRVFGKDAIVNHLTAAYIIDKLQAMDCSNITRNEYLRRFKAMLSWGEKMDLHDNYGLIRKLQSFKEETTKRERIQDKYLEPDEAKKLLAYMENHDLWKWYYLTNILLLSGMRIGEAIALEDADVDAEAIHVAKTYDPINRIVTTPKTLTSTRDVYIQQELADIIKRYRIWRREYNFEHGIKPSLFFSDRKGEHISYYSYDKYLREASEHELGRRITPHTLRHTHVSLLAAKGVPIETITRRVGHENSRITRDIYLHTTKSVIEADNEAIRLKKIL